MRACTSIYGTRSMRLYTYTYMCLRIYGTGRVSVFVHIVMHCQQRPTIMRVLIYDGCYTLGNVCSFDGVGTDQGMSLVQGELIEVSNTFKVSACISVAGQLRFYDSIRMCITSGSNTHTYVYARQSCQQHIRGAVLTCVSTYTCVQILTKQDSGWWKGRAVNRDVEGWFPASYVEEVAVPAVPAVPTSMPPPPPTSAPPAAPPGAGTCVCGCVCVCVHGLCVCVCMTPMFAFVCCGHLILCLRLCAVDISFMLIISVFLFGCARAPNSFPRIRECFKVRHRHHRHNDPQARQSITRTRRSRSQTHRQAHRPLRP